MGFRLIADPSLVWLLKAEVGPYNFLYVLLRLTHAKNGDSARYSECIIAAVIEHLQWYHYEDVKNIYIN